MIQTTNEAVEVLYRPEILDMPFTPGLFHAARRV